MLSCMDMDPRERPTFHDLTHTLACHFACESNPPCIVTRNPETGAVLLAYNGALQGVCIIQKTPDLRCGTGTFLLRHVCALMNMML